MDNPFEVSFIEDLFVFGGAEQESTTAEIVDLAGDALGVVRNAGDEAIAEDRGLGASDAKMMLDVSDSFLEIKGAEVVADGDPLMEGLVRCKAEELGQVGLTQQDQGQQRGGVHMVVEQEAELIKNVRRQAVSLVEDEQEVTALAGQVGQGGAQLG